MSCAHFGGENKKNKKKSMYGEGKVVETALSRSTVTVILGLLVIESSLPFFTKPDNYNCQIFKIMKVSCFFKLAQNPACKIFYFFFRESF